MRNLLFLTLLSLAPILFSSCSQKLVPLTDSLRKEYNLDPEVMPKLQYYVSKDVIFTGGTSSAERDIKKGVIYDTKGKNIEEITILERTPGICVAVSGSSLEISVDNRESPLTFEVYPDYVEGLDGEMIKKDNPKYRLQAKFWGAVSGEFTLGEKSMHTSSSNRYAHLLVDLRKVSKIEKEPRVARGEKVRS